MRTRNRTVSFRMNEQEYSMLQEKVKRSGQTQQAVIISAISGAEIATKEEIDEIRKINRNMGERNRQIRGMAINVNQMAHMANALGRIPEAAALSDLSENIREYWKEGEKEWQSIRQLIKRQNPTGR